MIRKDTHYICQTVFLTGALMVLGLAFGQVGLLIAGGALLALAIALALRQAHLSKTSLQVAPRDKSQETPESW